MWHSNQHAVFVLFCFMQLSVSLALKSVCIAFFGFDFIVPTSCFADRPVALDHSHHSMGALHNFLTRFQCSLKPAYKASLAGTGQVISSVQAHSKGINAVSMLPSSQGPLALSAAKDHTVRLWSAPALQATQSGEAQQSPSCLAVYKGHTDCVEGVAASPSGAAFCSGAWDATVHIWHTGNAWIPCGLMMPLS